MTYKQKRAIVSAATTLILLSGCSSNDEQTAVSSEGQISETSNTSAELSPAYENTTVTRKGLLGEDASIFPCEKEGIDGAELYYYSGYGYIVPSNGKASVSSYGENTANAGEASAPNYTRIETGSKIGNLIVYTSVGLLQYNGDSAELMYQSIEFVGKEEFNGYLYVWTGDEGAGYVSPGDIWFMPADGEWENLPVCDYENSVMAITDSFVWQGSAPPLHLGNLEDYTYLDLSGISDGKPYQVTITLDNITLNQASSEYATQSRQASTAKISGISESAEYAL